MDKASVQKIRDGVLEAVLPAVSFDGWTWDTVIKSAAEAGYTEAQARAVFPGGISDALDGFSDMADRAMLQSLADVNIENMRIRDRVKEALLARFTYLQPYKDAVRLSLAYWAVPTRKARAAKIVWRTADRIWQWAGDTAQDYNHYTKRTLLSGVIVSTTLAWLGDEGEDMQETKEFLERRIENVMTLGRFIGRFKRDAA